MFEIWKDISGYENEYQVSNLGRIKSLKSSLILKPMIATNGYLIACLWKHNKQKKICVHRLVANAFLSNPNSYTDVNHIDENKKNNSVSNLQWCTHLYNMNYGNVKKLISEANKGKTPSLETKLQTSIRSADSRWINNGVMERFITHNSLPEYISKGWIYGRLKKRKREVA